MLMVTFYMFITASFINECKKNNYFNNGCKNYFFQLKYIKDDIF